MRSLRLSSTSFTSAASDRRNNFDFLRFLFASLVLFYHCFPLLQGDEPRPVGLGEQVATLAGGSSVNFFFVISGFLVTMSWQRSQGSAARADSQGNRAYLRKRILRIYPGFLLASAACAFAAGPLGADSAALYWHHFKFLKFALYLFLLPADVVGPDMAHVFTHLPYSGVINGSFWTLRYEFEMYLLVAALGSLSLFQRGRGVWVGLLFLLLYALFVVSQTALFTVVPDREVPWVGNPVKWLRLSVCFLSGVVFYLYRDRIPASPILFGVSLLLLLLAGRRTEWFSAALPICGTYTLFSVAFHKDIRLQRFAHYGDFSYGMYLYAFPIQQLLILHFAAALTPYWLFAAAFPLTLLCAAVSWHLVERPCLALKGGFSPTRIRGGMEPSPDQLDLGDHRVSP